jgi:ribosomal subunit interface protein
MKRTIEIKHVAPREQVRQLLEELCDRLEEKLQHFRQDAVSLHVQFEESGNRKLCRTSVSCHIPGHMVAAHEESRTPGPSIRKAFKELERQLSRHKAHMLGKQRARRSPRRLPTAVSPEEPD